MLRLLGRGVVGEDKSFFSIAIIINLILLAFILTPIAILIAKAFITSEGLSLKNFSIFFSNRYYRESLYATFLAASFTVLTTSLIGIPLSYIMVRYEFPFKSVFSILVLVPLIMPPFIGALGLYKILGFSGMVNIILVRYLGIIDKPLNLLYGEYLLFRVGEEFFYLPYGIVLIDTLHLYPLVYLNCVAALSNIDPSLEEQAENLGAKGFYLFRTVTFPLMRPGWLAGAVIVFIWTFSDLGTPLIVHYYKMLPVIVFFKLTEITAGNPSPVSYVIGFIMAVFAFFVLITSRKYISLTRYAMLMAGGRVVKRVFKPSSVKLIFVYTFLVFLIAFALSPHIGLTLIAFSGRWSVSLLPESFTTEYIQNVLPWSAPYLMNTFIYAAIATLIDVILGAFIAYLISRKVVVGQSVIDFLATLPLAMPGIVFALGYWLLFYRVPFLDPMRYTPIILTISYSMRRLPYSVRAAYAGMLQIDESLEEASINLGATRLKTFRSITLPLLITSLFAGGILSFINIIIEVSTTFMLVMTDKWAPATWFLYFRALQDPVNGLPMAAALGFIIVIVVAIALTTVNKILGSRMGAVFRL